ncbi:NepR family anti-sigma factor [Hyphomicrobium sp. CS1GBMeth3]|uniref:NepR family anti-sigma factor n=1 Tax=Hyphomicrobium sp. CS1GBMeth3 TaxID=1892845 RepID=UPI000B0BE3C2|nr:NepR family anti-sigma factor [Hyphomicrobium sp. CS1GBMeth3]
MSTQKSVQPAQSVVPEDTMGIEPTATIDEAIQGALGRKLRETYEQVVREQVPDKFRQLLDQLKNSETDGAKGAGDAKADNDST